MTKPLVSILIPAYNAERWIGDTIHSALRQTWTQKEVIIVDDGSTDETLAIATQFQSRNVKVVAQENQGAASARNTAYSICRGDYIQWLDADDLLAPDKIERQIEALGATLDDRVLISSSWGKFMFRQSSAWFTATALWCDLDPIEFLLRRMEHGIYMQTSAWLVSRRLTHSAGLWNTSIGYDDDGEYFCRVLLASTYVKFVPEAKVFYRTTASGRLSDIGRSSKKLEDLWRSTQLHIEYLTSVQNTERSRAACISYLQHYLIYFYPWRLDLVEQMQETARRLGGHLETPRMSMRYEWIRHLLGWKRAKQLQSTLSGVRSSFLRHWDRAMLNVESLVSARRELSGR